MKAPMTDIWFRNAQSCMSVCAEEGVSRLTWTRQHLSRLKHDGIFFVRQFYMHTSVRPKIMLIGIQGTSEYGIFSKLDDPIAVYPTWSGKNDSIDELKALIDNPWGESVDRCSDMRLPASLRPKWGQKHRIIIHNPPHVAHSGAGQTWWSGIAQLQQENPQVELFVNGTGSFAVMFGLRFKACDFGLSDLGDPNTDLPLPNGVKLKLQNLDDFDRMVQWEDWIKVLGFTIQGIYDNKNNERYRFRIRSAKWAAKYWADSYRFHLDKFNIAPDTESSDEDYRPIQSRSIVIRRKKFTTRDADKILCNRCRIAPGCKLFRADSICGLRDSKVGDLEKFFQSRNAGLIVDGLAKITRMQARRLDNALDVEANSGETDPEVTKQIKQLFDNGVKLAKLVDPKLAGGPAVQVNVGVNNGNAEIVSMTNPKEVIANITRQLTDSGIPLEKQTPEMIEGVLKGMVHNSQPQAIESQVVTTEDLLGRKTIEGEAIAQPVQTGRD